MDFEFESSELKGMDWANDSLFFTYEFDDETSQFDPGARFCGDYYSKTFRCRIPLAFENCEEMIDKFICMMDDYPDVKGFWIDAESSPL